jgi:hypothetical protein
MVEAHAADRRAIGAERVDVAVARLAPVAELDAQLVGRLGLAHEIGLVEAQGGVEMSDVRHGRLADADGADLGRFHQADGDRQAGELGGQGRGRHPAGGAAADD